MSRDLSPSKKAWKPSFTYTNEYKKNKKMANMINQSLIDQTSVFIDHNTAAYAAAVKGGLPNYNIISELNGQAIIQQDKDIEIERLKTTCFDLNNKAEIVDDLRRDNDILKKRL